MPNETKPGLGQNAKPGARSASSRASKRRGGIADLLSMDSERSARLLLFGAVGLILAVSAAFIGFGYWYAEVRPEGRTVLKASGIEVSYAAMKRRMEYELTLNPAYLQAPQIIPEIAYVNSLAEIIVITQAENELGITATDEEIEAHLRRRVGVAVDADPRAFADKFRDVLETSRLSESEYRRLAHAELLADRIREKFRAEAPATIEQARIEVISTTDDETIEQARARVAAGEPWGDVARELSIDPTAQTTGGLEDYQPNGAINRAYNDYAFSAPPGEISQPLFANDTGPFYIVRVVDRSEQPLLEEQKDAYAQRQYDEWLVATQEKITVERHWDPEDQLEAYTEIDTSLPPQQPQAPLGGVPTVLVATPSGAPSPAAEATPGAPGDSAPDPSGAPQPDNGQ